MNLPCLLFDPECPMCFRFKQALEKMTFEPSLSFMAINDPRVNEIFPELAQYNIDKEVHLVASHEPFIVYVGPEVIEYLAKHNPKIQKLAWLLDTEVGQKASQAFYQSLNKVRQSLQSHCPKCKKN